jgi:hypothetical protein
LLVERFEAAGAFVGDFDFVESLEAAEVGLVLFDELGYGWVHG